MTFEKQLLPEENSERQRNVMVLSDLSFDLKETIFKKLKETVFLQLFVKWKAVLLIPFILLAKTFFKESIEEYVPFSGSHRLAQKVCKLYGMRPASSIN